MRLWVATSNSDKFGELGDTSAVLGLQVDVALLEVPPVEESGTTYYQNAFKKAAAGAKLREHSIVIADDSGLEVPALGGLPGVHSARFSWTGYSGCQALQAMLEEKGIISAHARFVCCIVGFLPDTRRCVYAFGQVFGTVFAEARGRSGFGYDPLFVPDGQSETFAEMSSVRKAVISHRATALKRFTALTRSVTPQVP